METVDLTPVARRRREMLSKVPEVTLWFWIIKILCTTVGESFADWINMTLGVGLEMTAVIFTVVLALVLTWQLALRRYVPFVYWLTVVVVSVTGTLYTDILTDSLGVPLALSTTVFAALLAGVFGVWWSTQRTLSIHSITTTPRELFYWLAILVTFALGTAAGDWILELTGWAPGISVLLPAGLIVGVVIGWRLGANSVLAFWLAYILTRPLGANLGDWLGLPADQGGIGLGVGWTSVLFLGAILATVIFLTVSRSDVIHADQGGPKQQRHAVRSNPRRERLVLAGYGVLALATAGLLIGAAAQPHGTAPASEEEGPVVAATLAPGQSATEHLPAAKVAAFRAIVQDASDAVAAGDQGAATAKAKELERAWDDAQSTLEPLDETGWTVLDGQIDDVLSAIRASTPDAAQEKAALATLQETLG
ncbi:hypothetical protein [Microbacterium kyungheense]|uniref:Putative membrane-anchored protein n=1 Tax=Microbacterium kyungheense TaxID=1263636 RepID=A0A543F0M5_9MICO|nr:hypothetical protein [Microbacterium kyungheense]TQM27384.1 putative membrane-anchored protein [Microbacterium kyungheense]